MCGITGLILSNGKRVSSEIINVMANTLSHRGPDGSGVWVENNVGIGHRRLSIIDLSTSANQPMVSKCGRYIVAYNGELYNYKEIRLLLEGAGYHFVTASDTEVLMYALAEWGTKALNKFNGMFAFAFWDRCEKTLLLARDRYGIKPLYYYNNAGIFCFGSEQKAITVLPFISVDIDKGALFEYMTFQNIFTDKTLLSGINLLPPGSFCLCKEYKSGFDVKIKRYWDYKFVEPSYRVSDLEYQEELDRLFKAAVYRQLASDVEIGSYLSGGIDSGSVTAIASKQISYLKTFTCGFDLSSASGLELAYDERQKAEAMSYIFKTEHYEMVLKSGDMERALPKLAWHLEEPRVGQSYPNFYAAKLASKFVKVVLSGTGGDEIFAGYPWRYYRALESNDFEHYIDNYYDFWQRLIPAESLKSVFKPIWSDVRSINTRDIFRNVFSEHDSEIVEPRDYINHSLYFEAKTFLHGLLVVEDKLSMAHGLETRVPFLDNDLVDFAMACPLSLKINNYSNTIRIDENEPGSKTEKYFSKTRDGKLLLRKVMAQYVPSEISEGSKQGFSAPDSSWFKGDSIDFVKRKLITGNPNIYNYFDRDSIVRLIGEHLEGKANRRLLIWSLLNLEEYFSGVIQGGGNAYN